MLFSRNLIIAAVIAIGLVVAIPARADDDTVKELTTENITDFIQKTAAMTSGQDSDMNDKEIADYLDAHIDDGAHFKSMMHYAVPGYEIQDSSMTMTKTDFINDVHKATESVSGYKSQIEISDIKISNDGKSATVKTRSMESGKMPVADQIEKEDVPIQGTSACTQVIKLNEKNVIQMYSANCQTDVEFQTF